MMLFQRHLIRDDLLADRLASNLAYHHQLQDLERRINELEEQIKPQDRGISEKDLLSTASDEHRPRRSTTAGISSAIPEPSATRLRRSPERPTGVLAISHEK